MGQLDNLKRLVYWCQFLPCPQLQRHPMAWGVSLHGHGSLGTLPVLATWAKGGAQVWPARACAS